MSKNFYPSNEAIKYLYEEMTEAEKAVWVPVFFEDKASQEEFNELLNLKEQLDDIKVEPSQSCINKILNFL